MASSIQALLRPRSVARPGVSADFDELSCTRTLTVIVSCAATFLPRVACDARSRRDLHVAPRRLDGIDAKDSTPVLRP